MKKPSKKKALLSSIIILFSIIAIISITAVIKSNKDEIVTTNTQINDELKSTANNISTSKTISDTSDYKTTVINNTTTTENLNTPKLEKNTQHNTTTTKVYTTEQTASKQYKVGDSISFGAIDGQSITWKILKVDNNSALIITDDIIAYKPYHINIEGANWEDSAIRVWLNQTFYDNAFSSKEKLHIYSDSIYTSNYFDNSEGFFTTDKIFLLSFEEVYEHFPNESSRKASDLWMLRTTGTTYAGICAPVTIDSFSGCSLPPELSANPDDESGVRPAMNIILPLD